WGGSYEEDFDAYSGYVADCPADKIADLARDAKSSHVAPDRTVRASMDVALPTINGTSASPTGAQFNVLGVVQIPIGDETGGGGGYTGAGVTVAVIDSGIGTHADLKNAAGADRVLLRWSAVSGPNGDQFGHGTHVAGIIGGNAKKSSGPYATRTFRGVAPDVRFISMKVLNADGSGQVSDVLEAIDWILQNRQQYGIKIVNMSLGHPVVESCAKDPLCQAVESLTAAGIVVVVSAGTWGTLGYGSITSPGIAPHAITIGAIKDINTTSVGDD